MYGSLLGLAMLLFWVWAIADVLMTPDGTQRALPKFAWALVVILLWVVGAFAWVALGRPQGAPLGFAGRGRAAHDVDQSGHLSDAERERLERREYYRRMDEELDRRLEERRREQEE